MQHARDLPSVVDLMMRCIKFAILLAGMVVLLVEAAPCTQQNPKRLILKDGSYQTATQWEVAGNHVRYYSAERYIWEELPSDLVDWPATEKYNRERSAERGNTVLQLAKGDDEGSLEPPLAAPGLRLPDGGGVFVLDTYRNQPQLLELAQNGGELNRHTGRNILRAAVNPLALSARQTIELKGERARVQSHVTQPVIYIDVDTGEAFNSQLSKTDKNGASQRYGIVRVEQKKGLRVVGNLNIAVYGKVTQKEKWIKTTAVAMGEWTKVTPDEPLPAGEYAVVELLEKGEINLYVWDFGVDPSAPANPNAWTPRHATQGLDEKPPSLGKRPN